ncbi:MAG: two pore domain potassium channel family protein [Pseudanabaena sp. M57BS1SP1A06MG]|uniref:Two pore domain potassium channel family protein n=2 Tax=Pseudanabaena mucicola TaxID=71190 RepID=A0ABR8A152_9CYAN|nr:two pore domain potassium channel family protein [Pseudanabaena mucicola FACHB-723]MCA6584124.1 two pore domain potassium channel family protein [Pseudanabaena sp. M34BS1SP1A06MG]MCA6600373.1 two pore domain potassium channel family protein [Pseudanabaena sp. M57BS1SP1A06MG]
MANLIESIKQSESIQVLARRFVTYLVLSAIFILLGLGIGVIGYHWFAGLSWVDSLVEAAMILSGMGPISPLPNINAKIFASTYALFSGLVFVLAMGIVLSPVVYSLLRHFDVNKEA